MVCPNCGRENPDQAARCYVCGADLTQGAPEPQAAWQPQRPQTSGMAIAALVLGILGIFTCGLAAIVGLVLGIIALSDISRSRGQLTGRGMAIAGICTSAAGLALAIGVTTAMLYPVFFRARERARDARCLSNIRQLGMALMMYASDFDEVLPPAGRWSDGIVPYLKNRNIFVCPNVPNLPCGYAFNRAMASRRLAIVGEPHRTVLLFESDLGWNGSGGPEALTGAPRHDGQDTFAFADGHAKKCSRSEAAQFLWRPAPP